MKLIRRPLGIIKKNRRAFIVLNIAMYGALLGGLLVGHFVPGAAQAGADAVNSLSGVSPAVGGVNSTLETGNLPALIVIILISNVIIGGIIMALLPSLIVPFSGIVIHVVFMVFLGLTYAPQDGWGVLAAQAPTLLLEAQAYTLFTLGVYVFTTFVLKPSAHGFASRAAALRGGLTEFSWLFLPAGLLLLVGAIYEAFEVIVILGTTSL